jgi:hypothetical protein
LVKKCTGIIHRGNMMQSTIKDHIDIVIVYTDKNDNDKTDNICHFESRENIEVFKKTEILRYILRSIDKYAPFINNIFLVVQTESQVPSWINREKITITTYEQFMPYDILPTYSSHTVEMYLHLIPGLSEKFIYFKDNVILWNTHRPEDFFIEDMCVNSLQRYHDENLIPLPISINLIYKYINQCSLTKAYDVLGLKYAGGFLIEDDLSTFLKSVNCELYEKIQKDIKDKSYALDSKDSFSQNIYIMYTILKNRCICVKNVSKNVLTIKKNTNRFKNIYDNLLTNIKRICLNNIYPNLVTEETYLTANNIIKILNIKLGEKCKYESSVSFDD